MIDELRDKCGIAAVFGFENAAELCMKMLHMLQHRGPEASGIATENVIHKSLGLVRDIFTPSVLEKLIGRMAIGHNRYSTCGENDLKSAYPHEYTSKGGIKIVGVSNGDIPRYRYLRERLLTAGYPLVTHNDCEATVALLAYYLDQGFEVSAAIKELMLDPDLDGAAYSAVFIIDGVLWVFRDPYGVRPLSLGRYQDGYVVASETLAFKVIGATFIRDIFPGEICMISDEGERGSPGVGRDRNYHCVFEWIYFARPDSVVFGHSVSDRRKIFGAKLWELYRERIIPGLAEIDDVGDPAQRQMELAKKLEEYVVIAVPDSANSSAKGFSRASGIEMDFGLVRSHYEGRGFMPPKQEKREKVVAYKYNPDEAVVRGKRVIVIDDSIVRSTTSRKLVRMLRNAGALEVIVLIGSPPIIWPCFLGVDTPTKRELVASSMSVDEIRHEIEADILFYLTIEGLCECLPENGANFCLGCFNKSYPALDKIPAEKFAL